MQDGHAGLGQAHAGLAHEAVPAAQTLDPGVSHLCRVPGLEGGRGWVGLWGGRPAVCPLHPAALCSEWGLAVHSESFAPQVVHMGWVSERLGGASSSQTFRPRFLALKGSSLYVFVSPPVSGPLGLGRLGALVLFKFCIVSPSGADRTDTVP